MKYLKVGDILYRVIYYPEIHLEIYYVKSIRKCKFDNTSVVNVVPIIGNDLTHHWLENTVNLNKLIKYKSYYFRSKGYFLTTNQDLAVKKLKTLLQYAPKNKK